MKRLVRVAGVLLVLGMCVSAASQASKPAQTAKPAPQKQVAAHAQKPPTVGRLKREVRLVNVVFSVLNKRDHFVTDLNRNNFEIFDNDIPQQVQFFNRETDLPLRIGLLLDTSNSIHGRLQFEQNAAFDFLFHILRPGKDLAFLMTFDTHPQLQQGFTDHLDLLRQAIFRQRAGGGTALYDAIYDASRDYLLNPPPPSAGSNVRRVLVVISDGDDDLSNHTRDEAIDMAERAGVVIYTISTNNNWLSPEQKAAEGLPVLLHYSRGDRVLRQFAEDTGGRSFYPYRVEDLARAFADISTELRTQYSIAYTPSSHADDGKFHRIRIEILHTHGLKVRARQGYWAPSPPGASGADPAPH